MEHAFIERIVENPVQNLPVVGKPMERPVSHFKEAVALPMWGSLAS